MDKDLERKLKRDFQVQRNNVTRRGIAWELTFEQWLAWWGDDIEFRGKWSGCLVMLRYDINGPYSLTNIKKGRPVENGAWTQAMRTRKAKKAKEEHEAFLDALMTTIDR